MTLRSMLNSFTTGPTGPPTARARHGNRWESIHRACAEALEGRRLLSFGPAATYPVDHAATTVATADFNRDGRADLAPASVVLLGRADGSFGPATYPFGGSGRSAVVGDFNNDGNADLASLIYDEAVSVVLGDGRGAFGAPTVTPAGMVTRSTIAGDVNADGKLDLVASGYATWGGCYQGYGGTYCYGNTTTMVRVMIGRGDGTFSTASGNTSLHDGHPSTSAQSAAALADFNGDGKLDLVHALSSTAPFAILVGDGAGNFAAPVPVGTGYAAGVAVGDLDGNGEQDVVTADPWTGTVSVHRGTGDGTFRAAQTSGAVASNGAVTLADLNGDGTLDVVTGGGALSVSLGNGDGTLRLPMQFDAGGGGLAADDFDLDGRPDVAAGNSGGVAVLLNDGAWPAADAPAVSIGDVTVTEGNTGTVTAAFTVSLSAATTQPVTVRYATADGTATATGDDYRAESGTLTFAAGQTSQVVHVSVNGDRLAENAESFSVLLSGASPNALVANVRGIGSIVDDEPTVFLDTSGYSAAEGNAGTKAFTFTVTLSAAYDAPVTVGYATADLAPDEYGWDYDFGYAASATPGADYTAASGTLIFAAGETSKIITVFVNGDRLAESAERFAVNLGNSAAAHIGSGRALGTIVDDEPRINISGGSVTEGDSGSGGLTFTVALSAASDVPVTVDYATADGSATAGGDYQAKSGSLTFAAGQTSQAVTIAVNGDRLGEQDETFSLNLTGATNAGIGSSHGYGTIVDDEPRINVNSVRLTEGNSGSRAMTFTATLSAATSQAVSVNYATRDDSATAGNDYVAAAGTLTFAAGQTSKTFTVAIRGDKKREADEYFYVLLSAASANAVAGQSGLGIILNDDF